MTLYSLMLDYARQSRAPLAEDTRYPELGFSLALLHESLLESGLEHSEDDGVRHLTAGPLDIEPNHLSRFVVGYLPFNSVSTREETNTVLFEVYAFLRWLEKRGIDHGLKQANYPNLVRGLVQDQDRCLQLSHHLDEETLRNLDDPPNIVETLNDVFQVIRIEGGFVYLQGGHHDGPVRLRLPASVLELLQLHDHLDLVLGDTADKWIVLEAGQVFPEWEAAAGESLES